MKDPMSHPGAPPTNPQTKPGALAAATLDADALAKLHELDPDGHRGVLKRVLTAFESSLVAWLAQIQGRPEPIDAAALSHIAHTLKSPAGSVGATDLAAACADIERRLRCGEAVDLEVEIRRLTALGGAVLASIRAMLEL